MTKEEVISILSRPMIMKNTPNDILEAHKMAVEALQQEPYEDCISRQAVLDQIDLWSKDELLKFTNPFYYLHKRIDSLPSAAPQSKVGYWTDIPSVFGNYECSECGCLEIEKSNYCQDCGAKMQEVEEE